MFHCCCMFLKSEQHVALGFLSVKILKFMHQLNSLYIWFCICERSMWNLPFNVLFIISRMRFFNLFVEKNSLENTWMFFMIFFFPWSKFQGYLEIWMCGVIFWFYKESKFVEKCINHDILLLVVIFKLFQLGQSHN